MSRTSRALAALVGGALVVALPVATTPADAASGPRPHAGSATSQAMPGVATRPVSARPTRWPVGTRTGSLTTHPAPATGAPAQQIAKVTVLQDRTPGTISFGLYLNAVPTADTDAIITVAFGTVDASGTCVSPQGSNVTFKTFQATGGTKRTFTTNNFPLPAAKNSVWTCAFSQSYSTDGMTKYDAVAGTLVSHIQKPIIGFKVKGKKLRPRGFTKVNVKILNSIQTVAKAPHPKLTWKSNKVRIRGKHALGNIAPGTSKSRSIFIKSIRRGKGTLKLTLTTGDYHRSITLKISPR